MKGRLVLLFFALVTVTVAQSDHSYSWSAASTPLHSRAEAKIFAVGPVGFAGRMSQEERQFKALLALDQQKAKQELERLYSSGNPQAMSYALVGMRKLDRKRYAELVVAARASDMTVTTMSGCFVESERLRTVADDLDSGKYDPWLRWMETHSL